MTSSIAGVWELISESRSGLIVATESYASALIMANDRRRFLNPDPTEAEEAAAYRMFSAQAGPYTISGTRLIHHRTYTRSPNSSGTDEEFEFSIDQRELILEPIDRDGTRYPALIWRKVDEGVPCETGTSTVCG